MKTLFAICGMLSLNLCHAQDYLPMLEIDHVWNNKTVSCPEPCFIDYQEHRIVGEEVIDGITYQRLSNGSSSCSVREDNGRIYVYDTAINDELLILDFSLELNDIHTFPEPYCNQPGDIVFPDMIVVDISVEMIAGEMRKVIYFEDTLGLDETVDVWIEGIGSLYGIYPSGLNSIDSYTELACFTIDGITYFFNGNDKCAEVMGLGENSVLETALYPNPIGDVSILQFSSELNIDTVVIYDLSGTLVSEIPVSTNQIPIDGSTFPAGLYFYQIYSEKQLIATEKFIVR